MHQYNSRQQQLIHLAKKWLADCNDNTTGANHFYLTELHTTIIRQRFIEGKTIREISENNQLTTSRTRTLLHQCISSLRKKYDPLYVESNRQFLLEKNTIGANY